MQELVSESLSIVGEELAITFDEIRSMLERYAEDGANPQTMEKCIGLLHSVNGALRMTETYGASLLTEEMEETCRFLEKSKRQDVTSSEALEALSRAVVQLPSYVELIINGGKDIPLVLLPLLNDLRAARGRPLLSESTLLLLNLSSDDSASNDEAIPTPSGEDIIALCRELRPGFQLALLGWIKGSNANGNLKKIGDIAERLQRAARSRAIYQLWWVVTGIVEALLDGGLEPSVSLKRLMGQADREMKRLPVIGEDEYAQQPPTELVNNFLYYIARATTAGERVTAVRSLFDLSELMPGDQQVEVVRESLGSPSTKLMHTVSQAICDDIANVKDVLDIYVRTGMENVDELVPQIELLKKIGDTLGVLGLGELREIIQVRRSELQDIIDSGAAVEEATLIEMASALLNVEDRLEGDLLELVRPAADAASGEGAADDDKDFEEVQRAVMRECVVNLARVKDAVAQIPNPERDGALIDAIPAHLGGIVAGLVILEKPAAVSVVEEIGTVIDALVPAGRSIGSSQLDMLADAIVSLEYYLETLQAGRKEPEYMLDNARDCLVALRDIEAKLAPSEPETPETGMTATVHIFDHEPTLVVTDDKTVVDTPETKKPPVVPEGVDPELLELFIEEAGEEIESIGKHFPAWQQDQGNHEALITVRRSFHTLKGSGRMVGAELIGEYCWSIEDLLNRLINRTLELQPEITAFLQRAVDALPELLEQLEVGDEPEVDIKGLMDEAAGFLQRESQALAEETEPEPAELVIDLEQTAELAGQEEAAGADTDEATDTAEEAQLDEVLLDILSKETAAHLAVIDEFVTESRSGSAPFVVGEDLHRACHTLHGSFTMANVGLAAGITGVLNSAMRRAFEHELPLDQTAVELCAEVSASLVQIVAHLSGDVAAAPDTGDLEARLAAFDERLEQLEAEAQKAAEESLPPVTEEALEADETGTEPVAEEQAEAASDDGPAFDPEIAEIFSDEAAEVLENCDAAMEQRVDDQLSEATLAELQRYLHTLKGGARMVGLMAIGDFSHDIETLLVRMTAEGDLEQNDMRLDALQASLDELHRVRDQIAQGQFVEPGEDARARLAAAFDAAAMPEAATDETAAVDAVPAAAEDEAPEEVTATVDEPEDAGVEEAVAEPDETAGDHEEIAAAAAEDDSAAALAEEAEEAPIELPAAGQIGQLARELDEPPRPEAGDLDALLPGARRDQPARERRDLARVDPAVLENLLNAAGEVSIFHSRLSQQLGSIQFNLDELDQTVVRLKDQLRNLEIATEAQIIYQHQAEANSDEPFDPLSLERYSKIQQLSRALAETTSDISSLKDLLQNQTGDTEALLVQQARTAAELQDGLMRTRMVSFEQHTGRLARLVRQMSAEQGKQAELTLQSSGEIDRQVLEKMVPALEHMIRNAVIHGIESADERKAAGKPESGQIAINLRREGSQVVMEIADDGAGIDLDSIRRKAVELELVSADQDLTDQQVLQFVLRSGFSTADQLTQAAGRGVGMDAVASEISKLGGTLQIETEAGRGTTFAIYLPYTLAVTQALIVRTEAEFYAIPLPTVEGIIRIPREEFETKMAGSEPQLEYGGQTYHLRHLGLYLGLGPSVIADEQDRVSIVLVQAGEHSTALIADEMLDSREIVVKPIGGQLAAIRGISGATILGDGRIVIILDVGALVRMTPQPIDEVQMNVATEPEQPLALVVDDSITMRRVTQRLLERNNMRVLTAKDGVEAVGILRDHQPDIILLDVEMPRMDGYEFATHVRNDSEHANIPIIMITSRVSENHKARAIELGVNDYLGKPYQEEALLEAVRQLLTPAAEAALDMH